jgi:hypothetical protein
MLARELHGVRVNAISRPAVVSAMEARVFGDRINWFNDWVLDNRCLKQQRIASPGIADLVLFPASLASHRSPVKNIAIDARW